MYFRTVFISTVALVSGYKESQRTPYHIAFNSTRELFVQKPFISLNYYWSGTEIVIFMTIFLEDSVLAFSNTTDGICKLVFIISN